MKWSEPILLLHILFCSCTMSQREQDTTILFINKQVLYDKPFQLSFKAGRIWGSSFEKWTECFTLEVQSTWKLRISISHKNLKTSSVVGSGLKSLCREAQNSLYNFPEEYAQKQTDHQLKGERKPRSRILYGSLKLFKQLRFEIKSKKK